MSEETNEMKKFSLWNFFELVGCDTEVADKFNRHAQWTEIWSHINLTTLGSMREIFKWEDECWDEVNNLWLVMSEQINKDEEEVKDGEHQQRTTEATPCTAG